MSWPPPNSAFNSAVFRRILATGSLATLLTAVCLSVFSGFNQWQEIRIAKSEVRESLRDIVTLLKREGREAVVEELNGGELEVWEPEWLIDAFNEGELIFRITNPRGQTLLGTDLLDMPHPEGITRINYGELASERVFAVRFDHARTGHALILGRFLPPLAPWKTEEFWSALKVMLSAVVLVMLITAFAVHRVVIKRLSHIATTAGSVSRGELGERVPITDKDDEFDRVAGEVNLMLDKVDSLTRHLKGVSIGAAHDLKTPVSNLGGRLELMERDLQDPEALQQHIGAARDHIGTLLRTLNAMLRLGEVEAGRRRSAFKPVDLSALVTELVDSMGPVFEDADKTLTATVSPQLFVAGDADLLQQLLINLLENAIEHTRDGAKAALTAEPLGDEVSLCVTDDGPGIPLNMSDSIFDRFQRVDASRTTSGNGLGLSLVRSIAELHEGSATLVRTSPGASFEVRLPRLRAP